MKLLIAAVEGRLMTLLDESGRVHRGRFAGRDKTGAPLADGELEERVVPVAEARARRPAALPHRAGVVTDVVFKKPELAAAVTAEACVWRSVTPWGTALAWWTVALADAAALVPHPVEVEEILWLTEAELLAEPSLLEGNREFLLAVRAGQIRL